MKLSLAIVALGLASPALAAPEEDRSLLDAAEAQGGAGREALDRGIALLETGDPEGAAVTLSPLAEAPGELGTSARYQLGKALYRLGFLHAALAEFDGLLADGPKGRYFRASLEWCLFIGRKMVDDTAVNEVLDRQAEGALPERYRDEFLFRLARYHFTRGLVLASTAETPPPPPPPKDEGISFDEDLFGDPAPKPAPPPPKPAPPKSQRKGAGKSAEPGGGIRVEEDLFGDSPPTPAPEPTPEPSKARGPEAHFESARRLAMRVSADSAFAPRARFLEALLAVGRGEDNEALSLLKQVVETTGEGRPSEDDRERRRRLRLRELAFFQLARLHFGARQPSFSIFYYKKVSRDSLEWLDSLYEASWAEYRLGNHERALGNLLTVHAPFFDDTYFPESIILEAVIYYENCRYEDASRIIDGFLSRYEPVFEELERLVAEPRSPETWYGMLAARKSGGEGELVARVLSIALEDPELVRLTKTLDEIDAELNQLGQKSRLKPLPYIASRRSGLEADKARYRTAAGEAIERKLRREALAVKELVSQALRVKVETARAEAGRLQASLSRREQRPRSLTREEASWTDDEKLVWPFEGEYWRDELGTYELTLARTCR